MFFMPIGAVDMVDCSGLTFKLPSGDLLRWNYTWGNGFLPSVIVCEIGDAAPPGRACVAFSDKGIFNLGQQRQSREVDSQSPFSPVHFAAAVEPVNALLTSNRKLQPEQEKAIRSAHAILSGTKSIEDLEPVWPAAEIDKHSCKPRNERPDPPEVAN